MNMKYLLVDGNNHLKLIHREHVEAIWRGRVHVGHFGCADPTELRLVSVMCDKRILPQRIFLLRMALTAGYFTPRNFRALRSFAMPSQVTVREMFQHHSEGWPTDFFTPVFAIARCSGWCAHVLEQLEDNRLYRPLSEYVGEPVGKKVVPLKER